MSHLSRISFIVALSLIAVVIASAAPVPYSPDANTVYLFHMDEPSGASVATNSVTATVGTNAIVFDGNNFAGDGLNQPTVTTILGATSYAGFGNCADSVPPTISASVWM